MLMVLSTRLSTEATMLKAINPQASVVSAPPDDPLYIRISHKMRGIIAARDEQATLFPRSPTPNGAQGYLYAVNVPVALMVRLEILAGRAAALGTAS
jgi:hypothetical protein